MGILTESHRRLRVGDGLNKRRIRPQHILQDVLGIAGRGNTKHLESGTSTLNLTPEALEHVDRVLNRVALRELVLLAQDFPGRGQQDGLGRGGPAVEPHVPTHD